MHGYIIQLSSKKPIKRDDFIHEDDFYDSSFVGEIADYVADMDESERERAIADFIKMCKPCGIVEEKDGITFLDGFKEKFFTARFEYLKKLVDELSIEDFAANTIKLYEISSLIEEKFDVYVYESSEYGGNLYTFDYFVRTLEPGVKYYIGGTVDYHC